MYQCPVCAYAGMQRPPADYAICPCCGTEFGYEDVNRSHDELRQDWINAGVPWFSQGTQPPQGWNGYRQLLQNGLALVPVNNPNDDYTEETTYFGTVAVALNA